MSTFDLCNPREQRFLYDLMEDKVRDDRHPLPEVYALLRALEQMWGGPFKKRLPVPPKLIYWLVVYATHAHCIHEDVDGWRRGSGHEVHMLLQGVMESVAVAIRDGALLKHDADGVYIDCFRIPQWFYDEVMHDAELGDGKDATP